MISYIEGRILSKNDDSIVVLTQAGLGFRVFVTRDILLESGPVGHEIWLYTYFQLKEDGMALFGFTEEEDLECFNSLLAVSGVGPKVAMSILSTISAGDLSFAIVSGDVKTICQSPGVGKKLAEKIIVELKDKFEKRIGNVKNLDRAGDDSSGLGAEYEQNCLEAAQILVAMGSSMSEAMKAVRNVPYEEGMTSDTLVSQALKLL